jgi:hypothetical protein
MPPLPNIAALHAKPCNGRSARAGSVRYRRYPIGARRGADDRVPGDQLPRAAAHRFAAVFLAIPARRSLVSAPAHGRPPFLPNSAAALRLGITPCLAPVDPLRTISAFRSPADR